MNVGGDRVTIQRNEIRENKTAGIGLLDERFFTDDRNDPLIEDNIIRDNVVIGNGFRPDHSRPISPAADIFVLSNGGTFCFEGNLHLLELPDDIVAVNPCPIPRPWPEPHPGFQASANWGQLDTGAILGPGRPQRARNG